jgi:DnaK suppressor protein
MTETQTAELKNRLLAEREAFSRNLQEHRGDRIALDAPARDAADRGDSEIERALEHRLALDDAHLIQKIDFALQRIEEGSYGTCEVCGAEIPIERLLAKPSVSTCRFCQQAKEDHSHVESNH